MKNTMFRKSCAGIVQNHVQVAIDEKINLSRFNSRTSNAQVICNKTMVREVNGKALMLGPRAKGVAFTAEFNHLNLLAVGETIELDGVPTTGLKATHGELVLKVGPFSTTVKPGPNERIGWGAIGFELILNNKMIMNLGDTLLHEKEWESIKQPDVLMIPIGGKVVHNTMDVEEAVQAVKAIQSKLVILCHYNCPGLFRKSLNQADDLLFKKEVEQAGSHCKILSTDDSLEI